MAGLLAEIKHLRAENAKLRNALAPFACLSASELRPGDFTRARRTLKTDEIDAPKAER
jgi:hypothetical protein